MTVSLGNRPNGTAIVFYVNLTNYAHKSLNMNFKHVNEHFYPKPVIRGSLYHNKKDVH